MKKIFSYDSFVKDVVLKEKNFEYVRVPWKEIFQEALKLIKKEVIKNINTDLLSLEEYVAFLENPKHFFKNLRDPKEKFEKISSIINKKGKDLVRGKEDTIIVEDIANSGTIVRTDIGRMYVEALVLGFLEFKENVFFLYVTCQRCEDSCENGKKYKVLSLANTLGLKLFCVGECENPRSTHSLKNILT